SEGLVVHAGDVMQPKLGLPEKVYADLAEQVDAIVHASALVNHALTYPHLFEPNVVGTVEVLRLALARRRKAVHFVSTGGMVAGIRRPTPILEDESAASLWPRRPVRSDAYALGYATSKWACEVLLEDLHRRCGVPVSVFRCGMILAHSSYAAQF